MGLSEGLGPTRFLQPTWPFHSNPLCPWNCGQTPLGSGEGRHIRHVATALSGTVQSTGSRERGSSASVSFRCRRDSFSLLLPL